MGTQRRPVTESGINADTFEKFTKYISFDQLIVWANFLNIKIGDSVSPEWETVLRIKVAKAIDNIRMA